MGPSPSLISVSRAGSTAVGQFAIQLGRLSGYRVITTASPKNHDFVKSLGADEAYDYKDESTPDKIREAHPKLVSTSWRSTAYSWCRPKLRSQF